jgi:hypothetical protein
MKGRIIVLCAALCAAFLAASCRSGMYDLVTRTNDDPFMENPIAESFTLESAIPLSWSFDPGADEYILQRAVDDYDPVFSTVYRGTSTSYVDRAVTDQTKYLYRLGKRRGEREFFPQDYTLAVGSIATRDSYEPNDQEEKATFLEYMIIANSHCYCFYNAEYLTEGDWFYVRIPPQRKANLELIDEAIAPGADTTHFMYVIKDGGAPEPVPNVGGGGSGSSFEIRNETFVTKDYFFKIYLNRDMVFSEEAFGGTLIQYSLTLASITEI